MRLERINWKTAEEYFKHNDMVILGVGSVECHGQHLALGTDMLIPNKILELMEPDCDVLIAPTLPYGACEYLADFPGTVNLGNQVLYAVLRQIVQSLARHGARKFLFMNGHGGNSAALQQVCADLDRQGAIGAIIDWWKLAGVLNPAWAGGHGGAEETSAMLAIDEGLVDKSLYSDSRIRDLTPNLGTPYFGCMLFKGYEVGTRFSIRDRTENGWSGPDHPATATKEWGEEMLRACADYALDFIQEYKKVQLMPK